MTVDMISKALIAMGTGIAIWAILAVCIQGYKARKQYRESQGAYAQIHAKLSCRAWQRTCLRKRNRRRNRRYTRGNAWIG